MDNSLTKRWAPWRSFFSLAQFICFGFLAITTAIMVFSAFREPIYSRLSEGSARIAMFVLVGGIYFLVDYGLGDRLRAFLRNWDGLDSTNTNFSAQRSLLGIVGLFLVLRLFGTGLSSIWAGGEISDGLNDQDVTSEYIDAVAASNETASLRLTTAQTEVDRQTRSEDQRIVDATNRGDEEIRRAIASGNPQQREMYRNNPAFFDNLNPNSQWTPGNQAYITRIRTAEANKQAYIDAEVSTTQNAQALLYSTTSDSTAGEFAAAMGTAAVSEQRNLEIRRSRHQSMIIAFDWFCLLFGLLSIYVVHKIDVVTDR
ncbi:MAG: hypothetical protein AAFY48_25680, partial [Bacteroidota bacterium]